jgi:chaperonin GroEL
MNKDILYDSAARNRLIKGMNLLSRAVVATIGPSGRYVILEQKNQPPLITRVGQTVARHFSLKDRFSELGVSLLKKVAFKTGREAGDGTATAILLAWSMMVEGVKNLSAGAHPVDLQAGMDLALERTLAALSDQARIVEATDHEIESVAEVAAHHDQSVANLVAEAVAKVKRAGFVTIEESKARESVIELKKGMQFDRGYLSPFFVTDRDNMEAVLEEPYLLLYDGKISDMHDLLPLLEECASRRVSLLIIADNVMDHALATLVLNKIRGSLRVAAVKSPGFGDHRQEMLEDIAAISSGTVHAQVKGNLLKYATIDTLGKVDKAILSRDDTSLILENTNASERVAERVRLVEAWLQRHPKLYDKTRLETRLARLKGAVAVIRVGAATATELKTRKEHCENALHAVRAALDEGIIPGGGVAYIRAQRALENLTGANADQNTGIRIIRDALEKPLEKILENAGLKPDGIIEKVKTGQGAYGYNVEKQQYQDLYESGIIDTLKVARIALETAASLTNTFLTVECAIAQKNPGRVKNRP